jgi:hypothetical protein
VKSARTCTLCSGECRKRDILCAKCWNGLNDTRKRAIQRATYRRDEVGKKFVTELLTCELEVIKQMIADSNGGILEPTKVAGRLKSPKLEYALNADENKKEAKELV